MHSDKVKGLLVDISDNIASIETYTRNMNLADFCANPLVNDAVERWFQRLTEASIQLGPTGDDLLPMHDRRAIRKFGNLLRHNYRSIRPERLWEFMENDLPALKHDTITALAIFPDPDERDD